MTVIRPDVVRSLLVVGAHAFDAEVIAGPLAAAVAARGGSSALVHLSLGEQGHRTLSPAEYADQKRSESGAAARRLGCAQESFDLPDGFLRADDTTALRLCDVIRERRPDVIVTHWSGSWHKDHRAAHQLTTDAVFYAGLPTLHRTAPAHSPDQVLFGENWEDDDHFAPTVTADVSIGMDSWRTAIEEYELARGGSDFPYLDYYASLYRLRGCLTGVQHAQAFSVMAGPAMTGLRQFLPIPGESESGETG